MLWLDSNHVVFQLGYESRGQFIYVWIVAAKARTFRFDVRGKAEDVGCGDKELILYSILGFLEPRPYLPLPPHPLTPSTVRNVSPGQLATAGTPLLPFALIA